MAGLGNKLNPNSMVLTDRGYVSAAEAEYQHSRGTLNIIGRDGKAVNSQELVLDPLEPNAQQRIKGDLESLIGMPALQAGDLYKEFGGFGSTLDTRTGIQSSQEMFNETYAEALANEAMANILETQGVPDVVSNEEYFAKMTDTLKSLGIDPEQYTQLGQTEDLTTDTTANDLIDGVDMLDPEATGLGGDESIVTDDEQWDQVDKTEDIDLLLKDALDIFGLGNLDKAIVNVGKVVNDRDISVQDVAAASGNTVEYVNDSFEKAGVKIKNQGVDDTVVNDTVVDDKVVDNTVTTNGDSTTTTTTTTTGGGAWEDTGSDVAETVNERTVGDGLIIPQQDVIVDDRPKTILPSLPVPEPQQAINFTLMQSIVNETPVTESILFPTKFTKLENVEQGMFERFLRAAGGR